MCVFSLQECKEQLEREIHLEFSRTMNQMCFDRVVQENPEEFSYIKVRQKEPERVPKNGQLLMDGHTHTHTDRYRETLLK